MLGTSVSSIRPASPETSTVSPESWLISAAACWERSASLRTSEATTAKPLPCEPARAASTAALSARRSVCRAISWMMLILSAIVFIARTARSTASPERLASSADWVAIFSVWLALSAFWRMLAVISSIEALACSAADACWLEPAESCSAVALMFEAPSAT